MSAAMAAGPRTPSGLSAAEVAEQENTRADESVELRKATEFPPAGSVRLLLQAVAAAAATSLCVMRVCVCVARSQPPFADTSRTQRPLQALQVRRRGLLCLRVSIAECVRAPCRSPHLSANWFSMCPLVCHVHVLALAVCLCLSSTCASLCVSHAFAQPLSKSFSVLSYRAQVRVGARARAQPPRSCPRSARRRPSRGRPVARFSACAGQRL